MRRRGRPLLNRMVMSVLLLKLREAGRVPGVVVAHAGLFMGAAWADWTSGRGKMST